MDDIPATARDLEARGYAGVWASEVAHDPFLQLLAAGQATQRLQVGTAIAVAFARSPMTLATTAYDLQRYTRGRFVLGLGTQIKAHVERRFSMPWSPPVARMRECVAALRAIWSAWQDGTPLRFQGEHYRHTLMTPMFAPDAHEWGAPPVYLAAVGPAMTRLVGEVADGLLVHGFTTERYLRERTLPALEEGLAGAGRTRGQVAVTLPGLVVSGRDEQEMAAAAAAVKETIAFYGSTPAYPPLLGLHGRGVPAGAGAARLERAGRRAAPAVRRPPRGQVDGDARLGRRRRAAHVRCGRRPGGRGRGGTPALRRAGRPVQRVRLLPGGTRPVGPPRHRVPLRAAPRGRRVRHTGSGNHCQ